MFTPTRSQMLLVMAMTAVILLVVAQVWRSLADIELVYTVSWLAVGQGAALAAAISFVSWLLFRLWPAYRESALQYMQMVLTPLQPADFLWVGLLPGLSEELLFRGVALPALGLVLSSVLFGVLHIWDWKQWPYAAWTTTLGFVLGGATLLTGNLLVAVIAHVLVNLTSCAVWYSRLSRV